MARTYATRRPERPPSKIKDPLLSPNATHHQITPNLTFIHRVPPTAPTPFSLTTAPASPLLLPRKTTDTPSGPSRPLPPLIRTRREKPVQRLSEEHIEEMRQLRAADPVRYTRKKLADQFNCSPFFVPMAAPLNRTEQRKALERRDHIHEANRNRWGERKKMAVGIRHKRKSLW